MKIDSHVTWEYRLMIFRGPWHFYFYKPKVLPAQGRGTRRPKSFDWSCSAPCHLLLLLLVHLSHLSLRGLFFIVVVNISSSRRFSSPGPPPPVWPWHSTAASPSSLPLPLPPQVAALQPAPIYICIAICLLILPCHFSSLGLFQFHDRPATAPAPVYIHWFLYVPATWVTIEWYHFSVHAIVPRYKRSNDVLLFISEATLISYHTLKTTWLLGLLSSLLFLPFFTTLLLFFLSSQITIDHCELSFSIGFPFHRYEKTMSCLPNRLAIKKCLCEMTTTVSANFLFYDQLYKHSNNGKFLDRSTTYFHLWFC